MKIFNILLITSIFIVLSCASQLKYYGLSQENYDFIKQETIGGVLDFSNSVKNNGIYIVNGKGYASDWFVLYRWGKSVKKIGIIRSKHAILFYEEIIGKKIDKRLKNAIEEGFNDG